MSKKRIALVGVKRCVDYSQVNLVRVKPDKSAIVTQNLKMSMNPFDEIAVTEAVKMKKNNSIDEIVAVSVGPKGNQETVRRALAMGADRGIHVETDEPELQPLAVSKLFAKIAQKEEPAIIILGKQAIDDDSNQTGQMIAAQLGWPQGTQAYKINFSSNESLEVVKEVDAGLQTVSLRTPCVVTCDLRLNEPVYANVKEVMKARTKPLEKMTPEQLGVDVKPRIKVLEVAQPTSKKAGKILESVDELVAGLKKEGVI